jgi:predicted nucleotidyltransferase
MPPSQSVEVILKILTEYFVGKEYVQYCLLYGSFAKGTEKPTSDVDIAIYTVNNLVADEKMQGKLSGCGGG